MRRRNVKLAIFFVLVCVLPAKFIHAQGGGDESRVHSDFRREWEQLHPCSQQQAAGCKTFSFGNLIDIGQELVTGQPLHIALGSLAPQNGFGTGLAFTEHIDSPNERRTTFDLDGVVSPNRSWRTGAYLTTFKLPESAKPIVVYMGSPPPEAERVKAQVAPVFGLFAETDSLNKLYFYGLGPDTLPAGKSVFGLAETIAGGSALLPLNKAGISFTAEMNGRVPRLRTGDDSSVPSLVALYNEATAPGIAHTAAFVQPGVGVQLQPDFFGDGLRLHYFAKFQYFQAVGAPYSFRRYTLDLGHEIALDRKVGIAEPDPKNGPDSCTDGDPCPTIKSTVINKEGSIGLRFLFTGSAASAGNAVPIYFDPTTGGSDLNGAPLLASYPDYRFRSPNILLLRGTVEHSLPKLPVGVYFSADAGKSPLERSDIDFSGLRKSYSVGITVHAGGLPVVYLLFAWGGNEGTHTTFSISNTLLGGSPRPSLF